MSELSIEELQAIADKEAQEAAAAQAALDAAFAYAIEMEEAQLEAAEKAIRIQALHVRLHGVSHNNVAYVEAFGHDKHWSAHHKEICECEDDVTLELLVSELEADLSKVNQEEVNRKVQKAATKASLEVKLLALGLTLDEIGSL